MSHITQIKQAATPDPSTQDNTMSNLSGLVGQISALSSAGVGVPGVQALASQIGTLTGNVTDSSGNASIISGLATQLTTAASGAISGLVSQIQTALSSLTSALGSVTQILHSHTIDAKLGHIISAFQGQHQTTINSSGITHSSTASVSLTAPGIKSNGPHSMSDSLSVGTVASIAQSLTAGTSIGAGGGITGASFGMLSDERLKSNIRDLVPVLEKLLYLRVKTFDVKGFDHATGEALDQTTPSLGLIAQELKLLFPQLVRDGKYLSIDIDKLIMVLLASFIEFASETRCEIEELREQIAELS